MTDARAQIVVVRNIFSDESTIGELSVNNGIFACQTLEDTVRRVKKFGETAIPCGTYKVELIQSPKFGYCPHLLEVPYFDGILIHNGNSPVDTHGCLLAGQYDKAQKNWVGQSRTTFKALMDTLIPISQKEPLWIEIRGGLTAEQMSLT